jgi:hypothetical protein
MTKDLTTGDARNLGQHNPVADKLYPTDEMRRMTDVFTNSFESPRPIRGEPDSLPRLPTVQERTRLHNRMRDLTALLRPASLSMAEREQVKAAVALMLSGWILQQGRNINPDDVIGAYTTLLCDLPVWAVVKTCGEFARGEAIEVINGEERKLSPEFAPSAPRVHAVARRHIEDQIAEESRLRRILDCKRIAVSANPEVQARVARLFNQMADGMRGRAEKDRAEERAAAAKGADEARDRAAKIREEADRPILDEYARLNLQPIRSQYGRLIHPDFLTPSERMPAEYSEPRE